MNTTLDLTETRERDEASAAWMRDRMAKLGLSVGRLVSELSKWGDDRPPATVLRSVQRMRSGHSRVSGELRAFLTLWDAHCGPKAGPGSVLSENLLDV